MTSRFRNAALTLLLVVSPLGWAADSSRSLDLARQLNEAFIEATEKVTPSVVVIDVAQREDEETAGIPRGWLDLMPEQWRERFQREQQQRKEQRETQRGETPEFNGQGSGVIISKEGDVLTNNHVVQGADKLRIRLRDGRLYEVEVKGLDEDSDLAVLRIKDPPKDLKVAVFADSSRVRVGEFAIAIGAPYGLDYSVSFGHVSAKGRSDLMGRNFDQDFLQTDANINPGNSGGPLVDIEGRVIGINSMIRGLNSGIGFAIPSNLAKEVAERLIADGKFVRSWLGLGIESLRNEREVQKTVPDLQDGVVVRSILPDGPSSSAEPELKPNDVITAVDGRAVNDPNELRSVVTRKRPGSTVVLDVRRSENALKVRVAPGPLPSPEERAQMAFRGRRGIRTEAHGLRVKALPQEEAEKLKVEGGVVVSEVSPAGPSGVKELRPGDVITEFNHQTVESPQQFQEMLRDANLSKGILLHVYRDGEERFQVLKERSE